jgi:hypothetical protein
MDKDLHLIHLFAMLSLGNHKKKVSDAKACADEACSKVDLFTLTGPQKLQIEYTQARPGKRPSGSL